ncbi:MAG: hypothetical protein K9M08_23515 [Pirellula sp.]|nr:hypothetical protein [Pirellula sp.]
MSSDEADINKQCNALDRILVSKWRISDSMALQLFKRSYPIEIPFKASVNLWRPGKDFPSLGEILYAFELSFGPSSAKYDDYKQSFSFPFLMEAKLGERVIHFVLNIWDYKGAIEFRFRRIIEREEDLSKKADVIQQCTERSDTEFEYIVGYLIGWIKGYVNTRCEYSRPEKPFYRIIPAALMIYGYLESFFCSHFEDSDSFDARASELKELIPSKTEPPTESNARIAEVMALIRQAKLESTDH